MGIVFLHDPKLYVDAAHFARHFQWPLAMPASGRLLYHAYWTGPLTRHHELCLKSLLITQSPPFEVWVWMPPDDLARNQEAIAAFELPALVTWKPYHPLDEARGTVYEGCAPLLHGTAPFPFPAMANHPLTVPRSIADAFRLLVLGRYGGFYFDFDTLFLKDLRPFSAVDFVYQWSTRPYGNNAILHFARDSAAVWALAERSLQIGTSSPRRLLEFAAIDRLPASIWVLPCFVFDPVWIAHDMRTPVNGYCNTFDDFFTSRVRVEFEDFFPEAYTYGWHNRWKVPIAPETMAGHLYEDVRRRFECQTR